MQKEKIDVVKLLHEGTWKKINNYFGKDLSLPYIYRTTRSHAYKEVFNSIQDSGVFVPEIPVTHALLYFYPGKITDASGRPMLINIFYGGTLAPEERIKNDKGDELLVTITRENVRNFLRSNVLVYGVGLASSEFHGSLEISNFLDSFDDSTSAVIAREILDVEASTFSKVLLRDKKIFGNYALARTEKQLEELKSTPIEEYMPSEEEVKKLTEEIDKLEKIKDYNPIDEWRKCLEVYSELKGVPQLLLSFDRFYEPFKRIPLIKRRNAEGQWEEIKPIL